MPGLGTNWHRWSFVVAVAVALPGIATAIGLAASLQGKPAAGSLFLLAVALATVAGGLSAGLLSTATSAVSFTYYFVDPPRSFDVGWTGVGVLVSFVGAALVLAFLIDRRERAAKRAQRALREQRRLTEDLLRSEIRLKRTLTDTSTASWEWDVRTNEIRWSENLGPMHGLALGEQPVDYDHYLGLIHPDDRDRVRDVVSESLERREGYELELRTAAADGSTIWLWTQASVVADRNGDPIRVVGITRDVTERKWHEQQEAFLAQATAMFSASLDPEGTLTELARLAVPTLADWCAVDLVESDGALRRFAIAHVDPGRVVLAQELSDRYPTEQDARVGVSNVVRTGRSELYEDITDELLEATVHDEDQRRIARELGLRSAMIAPLTARARILGALTLVLAETPRHYGREDLAFAEELGRRAGLALDNALLHRAEQEARTRAEEAAAITDRLQRLAAQLSAAVTPEEIARLMVEEGTGSLGAIAGWFSKLSEDGEQLVLVASFGYAPGFVDEHQIIPLTSNHAAAESVRTGEPLWLETTRDDPHPEVSAASSATGGESLAIMPLASGRHMLGFLALRFPGPRSFTPHDRELLMTVAGQYAQALERARLYEVERRTRDRTERLQRLTARHSAATTAMDIARISMEEGMAALDAPRATVALLLDDRRTLEVVGWQGYGDAVALPRRQDVAQDVPGCQAIRTGEPLFLTTRAEISQSYPELVSTTAFAADAAWVAAPLVGAGGALGALFFAFDGPRAFSPDETALLLAISRQSAQALERARLYDRELMAREAAERAADRLSRVQQVTASLAKAVTVREASRIVAEQVAASFDAQAVGLFMLSEDRGELVSEVCIGYSADVAQRLARIDLDERFVEAEALRRGRIVWVESATALARRFPEHAKSRQEFEAMGAVPLLGQTGPLGLLMLNFTRPERLDPEDRALLTTLARQCGQALERAQLYEREQDARRSAEEANENLGALQAIAEIGLTATSLEELFAGILDLVCDLLHGDRALLLLRDEQAGDLVVRAAIGVDAAIVDTTRVPWGQGIAGSVAASGRARVIDDVSQANVVSSYLKDLGSLVAVPLQVGRRTLGVIHVGSDRTNAFVEESVRLLELAADRIALAVEQTSLYEHEHEIAVTLQRSVLPEALPALGKLKLAARYVPGSTGIEVGGDWYDAFTIRDGRLAIVVGDVVGKGVLAAATMAQLRNALRVYAHEGLKPSSVLDRLNQLAESIGLSFATVFYAVLDQESLVCRHASAGHPAPLLIRANGTTEYIEGGRGVPLGVRSSPGYRHDMLRLRPGDTLLLYTDGLVERRDHSLDDRLELLSRCASSGPDDLEELLDSLLDELVEPTPRRDDVALLALRAVGVASELSIRLPADPSVLADLRRRLRTWLAGVGADQSFVEEVVVASCEACANAIEHPIGPTVRTIDLRAVREDGDIVISIRDSGGWRQPLERPDRGFGLPLMEQMVDELDVTPHEHGTEVTLRRRLGDAVTS